MIKFLVIGDTHFKVDNIEQIEEFHNKLINEIDNTHYDFIILLGDVLHTHERLHTIPLNKAIDLIWAIRKRVPLFILVGNHDYINNQQYLSTNHWMNSLKDLDNVFIVDHSVVFFHEDVNIHLVPYVPCGTFVEALDDEKKTFLVYDKGFKRFEEDDYNWRDSDIIFAHQEFKGCKMGAIISEGGDEWDENYPLVISGHIHSKQKPQDNIIYTGSSIPVAFGESENNTILNVNIEDGEMEFNEVDLKLKQKKIIYLDIENILDFDISKTKNKIIKLCLKGTLDSYKTIIKTREYKKLVSQGIKIAFKPVKIKNTLENEKNEEVCDFMKILNNIINDTTDNYLKQYFREIINS